uniref:Uncharacterized protein n=1 Tax=Avena sativa TaxID=4498 RepID=A0ACD6AVX6_AVESA
MSCFRIPISICEKIQRPISNFWWGVKDGRRKLHWKSWSWLSAPKNLGGMGFREMTLFNQAMLGKQCWRLLTDPNSLCARVLKGRYFPQGDFWTANCPRSASYTWRSIMHGKELLQKGVLWRIGDGKRVSICRDNWIPELTPRTVLTTVSVPDNQPVSSLVTADGQAWNEDAIRRLFKEDIADKILKIHSKA